MKRNSLKIVCDVTNRRLVYYFKNEFGDWVNVPSESPFSTSETEKTKDLTLFFKVILLNSPHYRMQSDTIFPAET